MLFKELHICWTLKKSEVKYQFCREKKIIYIYIYIVYISDTSVDLL